MSDDLLLMKRWALHYASLGWRVLPLHTPTGIDLDQCSCKAAGACSSIGKHPRTSRAINDATTDSWALERWWTRWPDANIGIACGDTFDVLDVDDPAALQGLRWDPEDDQVLPAGPTSHSGRGYHALMQPIGVSRIKIENLAIDWLSSRRFIVAPPSLHQTGKRYRWDPEDGWSFPIPPAPDWLARCVRNRPPGPNHKVASVMPTGLEDLEDLLGIRDRRLYAEAALRNEAEMVATAAEGGRNDQLYRTTFKLTLNFVLPGAIGIDELLASMVAASRTCGLEELEIERTIVSAVDGAFNHARNQ